MDFIGANKYHEKVKHYNKCRKPIISDVKDASIHNANIYPAITEHVISSSNDKNLEDPYKVLKTSELYVHCNEINGIDLIEGNKKVTPVNLTLEGLNRRSKFSQFLDLFNPSDLFGYEVIMHHINSIFKEDLEKTKIVAIPRIKFGDNIVLQRKKWVMRKYELLSILKSKTIEKGEIFLNLNKWRINNKIPRQVFIKLKEGQKHKSTTDNHKPQYIDFSQPINILLLGKILKDADEMIELTEILPSNKQVETSGGFVNEYLLNIG